MDSYSSDAPLNDPELDEFNRWPFSQRIADVIANRKDASSIIVGIYGPWGSGKTTVMNYIQKELGEHAHIVCLPFNPWRFRDEAELLSQFFAEVAIAIDKSLSNANEKIGNLIKKYGEGIATIAENSGYAGAKGALGFLANLIGSQPDLEELRKRIDQALVKESKRVVILLDDIDRMDRNEIHALFRLVKLTADFKNTAYVLAFDDDVVADALQERYGGGSPDSGRSFLEKIIQIPLHLPAVDEISLRKFCFKGVDQALSLAKIELSEPQVQTFVRHFIDGFECRIQTPRRARLYGNMLAFSLPILKGEVNAVDQMLIEGVRVFYPSLYKTIRSNPDICLKGLSDNGRADLEQTRIEQVMDGGLDGLDDKAKEAAKSLLTVLFPRMKSLFGNRMTYDHSWDTSWANEQKIASSEYFHRYFSYSIPAGDFPDLLISELLAPQAASQLQDNLSNRISNLLNDRNAESFIAKLRRKAATIPSDKSQELAIALACLGNKFPDPDAMMSFTTTFSQAAILVSQLIDNIPSKADRLRYAKLVIEKAITLPFALECYRWFRPSKEEMAEDSAFSEDEVREIAQALSTRISDASNEESPLFVMYKKHATWLLHVWREVDGEALVGGYIREKINTDPSLALKFLECFLGTSWGMESGLPHRGDFERDQYNSVSELVDPDFIADCLHATYGDQLQLPERYPHFGEYTDDQKLALQYLWLHRFVLSERQQEQDSGP